MAVGQAVRRQTAGARARAQAALAVVVQVLESSARFTEGSSVLEGSSWVRAQVSLEKVEVATLSPFSRKTNQPHKAEGQEPEAETKPVGTEHGSSQREISTG